jgi:hypothetical protein
MKYKYINIEFNNWLSGQKNKCPDDIKGLISLEQAKHILDCIAFALPENKTIRAEIIYVPEKLDYEYSIEYELSWLGIEEIGRTDMKKFKETW